MKIRGKFKKHFYVMTYTINLAMIPVFLVCLVTGILMFPGFLELVGIRPRNFPMDTVVFLHDWTGLALGAGILLHLILHFKATVQFVRIKILGIHHKRRSVSEEATA
jgi:cytochrome b subunit of formate dehydrogenase